MIVVICPGIHPPELTQEFVAALEAAIASQAHTPTVSRAPEQVVTQPNAAEELKLWVLPSETAPYGPDLIRRYVLEKWRAAGLSLGYPTAWIGFSAGVVGAVATARRWQREGGQVQGFIAVDGWGVPLGDRFPRFRLGHDRFTAQSCEWLGASDGHFYCDPAVEHLALWRSPQQCLGHWQPNLSSPFKLDLGSLGDRQSIEAAPLLAQLLGLLSRA